ncbi:VENN motif pre-toxin domain-containing protein [Rahnella inusitata]|uniref:VENN motif pre-toxin domain-containing protein n=1 Tax=Rahnella inusitata TaxID=58169 RepID=UPI0039B03B0B
MSSSGNTASQFMGNMANGMLAGLNNDGSATSTTGSAVADGTIVIRDKEKQNQDVADLSRDTDNAHSTLDPIFDAAKEQQRIDENRAIAQIGSQVADIVRTEGKIAAQEAAKNPDNLAAAKAALEAEGKTPTGEDIARRAYDTALNDYGTGSDKQKAVQAITAALQGLTGGDWSSAVAGATAPYMAEYIKTHTAEGAERIISHAIAGAVVADMQGGNAAAGAAGAGLSAAGAKYIAEALYPGKDIKDLSEEEKQGVVALATLASGIAGGVVGGDVSSGVDGAKGGKNEVENNNLAVIARSGVAACAEIAFCRNQVVNAGLGALIGIGAVSSSMEQLSDGQKTNVMLAAMSGDTQLIANLSASEKAAYEELKGSPGFGTFFPDSAPDLTGGNTGGDQLSGQGGSWNTGNTDNSNGGSTSNTGNTDGNPYTGGNTTTTPIAEQNPDDLAYLANGYEPNKGAVGNMGELLNQAGFGSDIKGNTQKSSQQYQGQSIYKATGDIGDNIKKGDQFYLDGQHKDHLELFDKRGNFKAVLNLDGTINQAKTEVAKGRKL